jgi:nucleotide-binding universal stress UspA family protein
MYRRILLPLDGSKLAECALPHAVELAKSHDELQVMLISVTEELRGTTRAPEARERYYSSDDLSVQRAGADMAVAFGKLEKEASRYLSRTAKKLETKGIKVSTEVLFWPPAEAIVGYAEENDVDIIVMSSHGRSGPSRRPHGRVADKVLKTSRVPVLMVRSLGCTPEL